ncbi:MAG: hypothetical protein CMI98_04825 [Pelagibacteraceae bacterium]|nr:hypothetical protein [Pelagibacteraceae bacterium]
MEQNKDIKALLILSFLFLLFKIISIYFSKLGLHGDEAQYWVWSNNVAMGYFSKPPLIAYVINFFTSIFGEAIYTLKYISVIFYLGTSFLVYVLSRMVFNERIAVLSGLTFFLLPGVSFSSFIISTDVLLLFFWTLSLYLFLKNNNMPSILLSFILGVSLGFGFLAKYAMLYFFLCSCIYIIFDRSFSKIFFKNIKYNLFTFIVFLLIISPNIFWNISNGWITFLHTYDNASLNKISLNYINFFEFLFAQIFIFGPIIFVFFLLYLKKFISFEGRILFFSCYSVPILIIIIIESFLVRAHGNWAAVSYVGLTILMVFFLENHKFKIILFNNLFSLFVGFLLFFLIVGDYKIRVFEQLRGYNSFSNSVLEESKNNNIQNIVVEDRMVYSLLSYYLRNNNLNFYTPKASSNIVSNHFQIKNGLPDNFSKNFIYIGLDSHLDYLKTDYEKKLINKVDINKVKKNVNIQKFEIN